MLLQLLIATIELDAAVQCAQDGVACILPTNVTSNDDQLFIAVSQWIAASVASVPRFELCVHNSTQLAQVNN